MISSAWLGPDKTAILSDLILKLDSNRLDDKRPVFISNPFEAITKLVFEKLRRSYLVPSNSGPQLFTNNSPVSLWTLNLSAPNPVIS